LHKVIFNSTTFLPWQCTENIVEKHWSIRPPPRVLCWSRVVPKYPYIFFRKLYVVYPFLNTFCLD
jgi:hypothetical protein